MFQKVSWKGVLTRCTEELGIGLTIQDRQRLACLQAKHHAMCAVPVLRLVSDMAREREREARRKEHSSGNRSQGWRSVVLSLGWSWMVFVGFWLRLPRFDVSLRELGGA